MLVGGVRRAEREICWRRPRSRRHRSRETPPPSLPFSAPPPPAARPIGLPAYPRAGRGPRPVVGLPECRSRPAGAAPANRVAPVLSSSHEVRARGDFLQPEFAELSVDRTQTIVQEVVEP